MSRHPNDTLPRLHEGAADPTSLRFVPVDVRDMYATIPAGVEEKIRRDLYTVGESVVTDARGKSSVLQPAKDLADLETAVVLRKVAWCRQQLKNERGQAERAAYDAALYTCACCGKVAAPNGLDRTSHTQPRNLADGTRLVNICGKCGIVADQLVVAQLAAETIGGKTRRDRAQALIAAARS